MSVLSARESQRQRLVRFVFLIYLLAIFEGSLRKWLLPQLSQLIFFIRDPFLLYAYLLATLHGLWPRRSAWLRLSWALAAFGALLGVLQAVVGGTSEWRLILGLYGWRSYFLYTPLAFLVGAQFGRADIERLGRLTLLLAVPIAVLVALQFQAPINSPINVGISSDAEMQFRGLGLNAEHTRPMGPFSSGAGQQQFTATAFAFLLAFLVSPARVRRVNPLWFVLGAAAVGTCVALSGSRGTVLQCALVGLVALGVGLVGRGATLKVKALALPAVLGAAALALYPVVFPVGFAAFMERWTSADRVESQFSGGVFGRALYGFIDFVRLLDAVPALGWGLGYGGNASILLHAEVDGVQPGKLAETDFARHIVDLGPAFGVAFIALRVVLVLWLARKVWRATRASSDPLPAMMFAYTGYVLLLGTITGQGAINFYAWLFAGLCLAACREALPGSALVPQQGLPVGPTGPRRPVLVMARTPARPGSRSPQ